jgi:hypothetical protein
VIGARIAYHRAKIEEKRAKRERRVAWRGKFAALFPRP